VQTPNAHHRRYAQSEWKDNKKSWGQTQDEKEMVLVYKPSDAAALRNAVTIAVHAAIQDTLKHPIHFKVNSSNIMHTDLQPEGDMFTIMLQVEVHRKETKDAPDVRVEP
jgi:hypothetical protein